jgi:hypothetical protein
MASRFAAALILVGLVLLTVFALTLQVQQGDPLVLLLGASLCGLGLLIRRRMARRRKGTSGRFSTVRRLRGIQDDELE